MVKQDLTENIFRCPSCNGVIAWHNFTCGECKKVFAGQDGILDFLSESGLTAQQKTQVCIHKALAGHKEEKPLPAFAKIYSQYWNEQYLSHLQPERNQVILDAGCGSGDLARALSGYAGLVVGMDISMAMLSHAKKLTEKENNIIWAACIGEGMPFADRAFDVVCFRGALHHMSDENAALKEAYRILRPGGLMMLSEPNDDAILLRIPRKIAAKKMDRFEGDHKAFLPMKLKKKVAEIGFAIVYSRYFSYLSQPLCGMSELLPLLHVLPFSTPLAKFLVAFDEVCSKVPLINRQSFDYFIVSRKPSP